MLKIENDGPLITASTYWRSAYARRGVLYLSVNAGALRILLPPALDTAIPDMATAREIIVSRGPWPTASRPDAIELLFDDGSDAPYAMHVGIEQIDRIPPDSESGRTLTVTVWRDGPTMVLERLGRYRRVSRLPCLEPWSGT
jgi:hypothetical protein